MSEPKAKAGALDAVHYIDLRSGYAQVLETREIRFAERQLCLAQWWQAQCQFVPMPEVRGIVLAGYTMRGQVVSSEQQEPGSRGGALLQINDPRGMLVSTVGFAWRAREGAYLWRRLLEGAQLSMRPMEYPREPWVTRRLEPGAARNAAMLQVLAVVEYAIAVAWLAQARVEEE